MPNYYGSIDQFHDDRRLKALIRDHHESIALGKLNGAGIFTVQQVFNKPIDLNAYQYYQTRINEATFGFRVHNDNYIDSTHMKRKAFDMIEKYCKLAPPTNGTF